jgi:hypothetical protein
MQSFKPRKLKKPHMLVLGRMAKHLGHSTGQPDLKRLGQKVVEAAYGEPEEGSPKSPPDTAPSPAPTTSPNLSSPAPSNAQAQNSPSEEQTNDSDLP